MRNLTNDGGLNYTYDATGQQATAAYSGCLLQQYYDGNGLRAKKAKSGATTYYLRSSVLGGQIVAEVSSGGAMQRGYVFLGSQLLAVQQSNAVSWIHQDPFVKSKRVTNGSGAVVSTIELDPWGGNTNRNNNDAFQPRVFTTYTRDSNAADDAMFRRYNRWWSRFDQPDPYSGSYQLTGPQTLNRYAYVSNDPVNFTDPTGLLPQVCPPEMSGPACMGTGFWGGGFNVNDRRSPTPSSISGGNTGRETIVNAMPTVTRFVFDLDENLHSVFIESSIFDSAFTWFPTWTQGKSNGSKDDRTEKFKACLGAKAVIIEEDYRLAVRQAVTTAALIILVDAVATVIAIGFETAINAHVAILPTVVVSGIVAAGSGVLLGKSVADASEKAALAAKRAYESCAQETGFGYEPM